MKFKRVEIQAFKSYLDKRNGTFDFTVKEGQPADIVSIYAPNGFGKTSLFDAIDFCMTNNITRFIRDTSLATVNNTDAKELNQDGQKQHILRAKNAPENLESIVKIITDTDEFERKVSSARTGSKDYAFDDKKTAHEERYFRSVMLPQEAIDGFLRELKPEIRYERFMAEQLGGDDTLEKNRQHIQLMLGGLGNRLDKLKSKVATITDKNLLIELGDEATFDSSCLTAINELATELNKQGCHFSVFDDAFNDESNARLLLQVAQKEENANKNIETNQTDKAQLEQLLNNFPVYEKNHHEIVELDNKISTLNKQKSDIEQFQILSEENKILTGQLDIQSTSLEKLWSREKQLPKFIQQIQTKRENNALLDDISDKLTKNEQGLKNSQAVTEELEKQRTTLVNRKDEFETLRNDAPKYFSEISTIEESIKQQNSVELTADSDELERKITDVKSEGMLLKTFKIEELDAIFVSKFNNEILAKMAKDHAESMTEQKGLHKRLAEMQSLLDSAKLQKDSISTLIELGSQLINHNQDEHCPLCQHKHKSFAVLADAINSNSSLSDTQQRILKDLEACQTQLNQEGGKLKQLSDDFSTQQISRLNFLRQQLKNLLQEKKSISNRLNQIEKDSIEVNRLKALTVQKTPELFKSYIDDEITKEKKAVSVLEDRIDEAKGQHKNLIKEAQQLRVDLVATTSQSGNDDEFITGYSGFLAELKVQHDVIEPELKEQELKGIIASQLKASMNLFEDKQQEIKSNDAVLKALYEPYPKTFFENSVEQKERFTDKITKSSEQLARLNGLVREFYSIVKQLGRDHLLEDDNWVILKQTFEYKVSDFHHVIEQNRGLISGLKSLSTLAEQVLTYVEFVKSTGELQSLKLEIRKYDEIKTALITDLRVINDSLKKQINHYFHVDLINTIYKKIDPHPDFKRIAFNCVFPDEGKPKLQVFIEDDEGNNIISPTLNFSSAQINVLSLSIFLAKALNTKNADKAVDCIFIDDPVQSMDSINVLGVIDLLRSLSVNLGKQIIISTHDDNFHALLKQELPEHLFKSKFLELESFGKVKPHAGQ